MSIHAPVFLANKMRSNAEEFADKNKEDILATIEFLYKRGMWSKFHYEEWKKEAEACMDPVLLHGWWDAIVSGVMFEADAEDIREMQEDKKERKGPGMGMMIMLGESEGLSSKLAKKQKKK